MIQYHKMKPVPLSAQISIHKEEINMKSIKYSLKINFCILILAATNIFCWEIIKDTRIGEFDKLSPPQFQIIAEKKSFLLYEPLIIRFTIKNISDKEIKLILFPHDPIECNSVISAYLYDDITKKFIGLASEKEQCEWSIGKMKPKEIIYWDYLFLKENIVSKTYKLKAKYLWGGKKESYPELDVEKLVNKEMNISIEMPKEAEKEAIDFVGNGEKLVIMQDPSKWLTSDDFKETSNKSPQEIDRIY